MAKTIDWQGWVKIPAYILASLVAIGVMLAALGFRVDTPEAKWTEHETEHVAESVVQAEQFDKIDIALENIDDRQMEQQTLIESIVTGECIENPVENLERQRLIAKCRELGIER